MNAIIYWILMLNDADLVLDEWLDRTAWLESRWDHTAIGDKGRSRGAYQIQRASWYRHTWRPWQWWAHDPTEARRVARLILLDCIKACRNHNQTPTFERVRWYYQHGGY